MFPPCSSRSQGSCRNERESENAVNDGHVPSRCGLRMLWGKSRAAASTDSLRANPLSERVGAATAYGGVARSLTRKLTAGRFTLAAYSSRGGSEIRLYYIRYEVICGIPSSLHKSQDCRCL